MKKSESKADTARALYAAGRTLEQIQVATGLAKSKIKRALNRRSLYATRGGSMDRRLGVPKQVKLSREHVLAFAPHAERRDMKISELVHRLIEIIATEDLVDGILDDADEFGAADRRAAA